MCLHPKKFIKTLKQESLFGADIVTYCDGCGEILGTWEGVAPSQDSLSPSHSEEGGVPKITQDYPRLPKILDKPSDFSKSCPVFSPKSITVF